MLRGQRGLTKTAEHPYKRGVCHAAGHLLPLVLTMSRQHIEVKSGIWLLEKMMVIRFTQLHRRGLHGLPNDQRVTSFADVCQKHKMECSHWRGSSFGPKGEAVTNVQSRTEHKHLSRPGSTISWAPFFLG